MNKKYKRIVGILGVIFGCIVILLIFVQYQSKKTQTILDLSKEQKVSDFDILCNVLDEGYPFWKEAIQAGVKKEEIYTAYRNAVANTKTDIEFFKEIDSFLKNFGGIGHLSVLDGSMYRQYMEAYSAGNGIFSELEFKKVQPLIAVLTNPLSQTTYDLLDQSHSGFRSTVGLKKKYVNESHSVGTESTSKLVTKLYEDKNCAYVKIDDFHLLNYESHNKFLKEFFADISNIPNLIIDLRENRGGSDLYWLDLLVKPNAKEKLSSEKYYFFNLNEITQNYVCANEVSAREIVTVPEPYLSDYKNMFSHYIVEETSLDASEHPYQGKIWVLVSEKVYSSSENFVMFCKNTGFATLIGTPTGGDGGIADPILVALPNSGLIIRFSMFYGTNADGSGNEANGTIPDISISSGEDALEKCLELIE